jgi:hypothetical protein
MWVLNVFLYLMFVFAPDKYAQFVAAGAPCYVYVPDHGEQPATPPPPCFYLEAK